MGKSRRNRANAARKDPISKTVKPPSDPELAALRESKILPIVRDLQGSDPKSRSAAARAISAVIQDARCRKLLLREQIVQTILRQTLTDAALESRAAGWGILQTLAHEEEADFCVHLYRQDVLSAISFAAQAVSEKLSSDFEKTPKVEQELVLSIVSSLISLLTALAESQDNILEAVSANAVITDFLLALVSHDRDDGLSSMRADALACVMVLSEDNAALAAKIVGSSPASFGALRAMKDSVSGEGVLACGILHNIFAVVQDEASASSPQDPSMSDAAIIPTLAQTIASITPGQGMANGGGWSSPMEYQQLALEILASIGTSLPGSLGAAGEQPRKAAPGPQQAKGDAGDDDDDMMDQDDAGEEAEGDDDKDATGQGEEGDDDDEMDADEMLADMDMVTGVDEDDDPAATISQTPVLQSLLQTAIPQLNRTAVLAGSDPSTLRLRSLALSALGNICWSVSLLDFSHDSSSALRTACTPALASVWTLVVGPVLSSDTADLELASRVTSLAWALARSLGDQTPLADGQHRKFVALYQATRSAPAPDSASVSDASDPFQSPGVKCVGVLGQLAQTPSLDLNREIGTFLVSLVTSLAQQQQQQQTPVADAVEALNQLFDIYANEEAECDRVFWESGFLASLEGALPGCKTAAKAVDKRTQTELRTRADEALLNLNRFLAYKRKHKPQ
ncbi:hypothetical protein N3K66_002103 [Trichothecium roseum]|uniref:Uncharacterized protein n=1 Tax=Trichothecium roseum TaxID=47278 RepID=A0ACC0VA23_9HYPO|nr:hypothetical protein N3K66_002103 [Trichothecium roseum]